MSRPLKNILVLRLTALGDVVMTMPILYPLCKENPDKQFTILTTPVAKGVFIDKPSNLNIETYNKTGRYKGVKGVFKFFLDYRNHGFDTVIDLHDVLRTKLIRKLFKLAGCRVAVIDKGRGDKRALVLNGSQNSEELKSTFCRYEEVFSKVGLNIKLPFTSLSCSSVEALPTELLRSEDDSRAWIGIAPISKHKGKNYPLDKMHEVVKALDSCGRYKVLLFGSKEDNNTLQQWASEGVNTMSLATMSLGFAKEMLLIKSLDTMLSMDSFNMHLAAIVGTPVVSIWGATHPYAGFLGWSVSRKDIIQLDMACRPCSIFGDKPCKFNTYACLDIPPNVVVNKIIDSLRE